MKTIKNLTLLMGLCAVVLLAVGCDKESTGYDVYENHDISVCGIDDPLQNIEWLSEYCKILKEMQNFSSTYIYLYKVIGTDEPLFQTVISYSEFDDSPVAQSTSWENSTGKTVFATNSGMPPMPGVVEEFFKDKEFVVELFHLIKK